MEKVMPTLTYFTFLFWSSRLRRTAWTATCLLLFAACEKVGLPSPPTDTPDFYTKTVFFNNQPHSWTAGEHDIYMHTDIRSINDSLQLHTSSFGLTQCDTCKESLHFDFLALKSNPNFSVGNYSFQSVIPRPDRTKVKVSWDIIGGIGPFTSIFQPGNGSTIANFTNGSIYEYDTSQSFTMKIIVSDVLNRTVSAEQYFGVTASQDVSLTISHIDSTQSLVANINQPGPISYVWNNGASNPIQSLSNQGLYSVTATLSNGVQLSQSVFYQPGIMPSVFGLRAKSTRQAGANLSSSQIRIRFYDSMGNLWSTDSGVQQSGKFFKLVAVNPYPEKDKAGRKVIQALLQFSCTLYNTQGDSIPGSGEAVVAIPLG